MDLTELIPALQVLQMSQNYKVTPIVTTQSINFVVDRLKFRIGTRTLVVKLGKSDAEYRYDRTVLIEDITNLIERYKEIVIIEKTLHERFSELSVFMGVSLRHLLPEKPLIIFNFSVTIGGSNKRCYCTSPDIDNYRLNDKTYTAKEILVELNERLIRWIETNSLTRKCALDREYLPEDLNRKSIGLTETVLGIVNQYTELLVRSA